MMHAVKGVHNPVVVDLGQLAAPEAPPKPAPTKPAPSKTPAPQTPEPREPVRPGRSPDPATHPCTQPGPSTCPAP